MFDADGFLEGEGLPDSEFDVDGLVLGGLLIEGVDGGLLSEGGVRRTPGRRA